MQTPRTENGSPRTGSLGRPALVAAARAVADRPAVVLTAIVAATTAWIASHSTGITEVIVMTDELQYVKLAGSIFSEPTLLPTIRGVGYDSYSHLYPLLISPLWALLDMPDAWRATHFLNALILASAAIPAYLLTREVVASRAAAYLVAIASVAIPWMGFANVFMTEVAAYPAFLWGVLGIHVAIARPSMKHDALALASIALAFLGRTQFLILAGILPLAVLIHEFGYAVVSRGERTRRAAIREAGRCLVSGHRVLVGAYGAVAVLMLVVGVRTPIDRALGNYGGTTTSNLFPEGVFDSSKYQLELVVVGMGGLPFVLGVAWMLGSLVKPADKRSHAYAVLPLLIIPVLAWEVASFGLKHAGGPIDRYLFYVVPLCLVATAAFAAELGARRRPVALVAAASVFIWLVLSVDIDFVNAPGPYLSSPASAFHGVIDGRSWEVGHRLGFDDLSGTHVLAWGVPLVAFGLALLGWFRSGRVAASIVAVLSLGFLVAETQFVMGRMADAQNHAATRTTSKPLEERDWVDDAVPEGATAAIVPNRMHDDWSAMRIWWGAEMWNKSVVDSYFVPGGREWTPFPVRLLTVTPSGGIELEPASGEPADYLVLPIEEEIFFRPAGKIVTNFKTDLPDDHGLELLEVDKPYRAAWSTDGFAADGWLSRDSVGRVRVFATDGVPQRFRVTLQTEMQAPPPEPSAFTISAGKRTTRRELAAYAIVPQVVDICAFPESPAEVTIRPKRAVELPDGRKVIMRLTRVLADPLPGACDRRP